MQEWGSDGKPIRQVLAVDGAPIQVGPDQMAAGAIGAAALADGSVATAKIADSAVTMDKAAVFVSTEQTGTGAAQNVAHGLGVIPSAVLIVPTDTSPTTAGDYTATEGAHTTTDVVVTVTTGKKFKVLAWA